MNLQRKLLPLVLAAATVFSPFEAMAASTDNKSAPATPTSETARNETTRAEAVKYAKMTLSQWSALPQAEKILAYDDVSHMYVEREKKANPEIAGLLEAYFLIGPENQGTPAGRELFYHEIQNVMTGKRADKGATADNTLYWTPLVVVGDAFKAAARTEASLANRLHSLPVMAHQ